MDVAACVRAIDSLFVSILCGLHVVSRPILVMVVELIQGPLLELVCVADILPSVNKDESFFGVMCIEDTFQMCLGLLKVLGPLCFEKLQTLSMNGIGMLLLEGFDDGDGFVEHGVVDSACYGYFVRHFVLY